MADAEQQQEGQAAGAGAEYAGGVVLQCGATDAWAVGRTKDTRQHYPNLLVPTRLIALEVGRAAPRSPDPGARRAAQPASLGRP